MRIAFFIGSMGKGGAERVISILANDYVDKGWNVDVVMLLADRVEHELRPQIRIIPIIGYSQRYVKNILSWLIRIRRYINSERPDRVVSFVGRINALVLTATLGMRLPVVVSERNDPKHDGRGRAMLWYCNKIYRRARKIVFQNRHEQGCFDASLNDKGTIIPNPVYVTAVKGEEGPGPIIATAGRLSPQKNHYMLIDAMRILHEKYPLIKCRIYGDGHLKDTLQQYIDAKELTSTVTLEGNRRDIHERLADCSVFVLTSNFEGLSNALIEAMMMGLPCITTDYPGADELIVDKVNGLIVPREDAKTLAMKIEMIIQNPELKNALSAGAMESSVQYRMEPVLKLWEQVIQ